MNSGIKQHIKQITTGSVLFDEPLKNYTTFGIGGPASCLVHPEDTGDLINILKFISDEKLPVFFIGSGSNILVSDCGFDGVIILLKKNFNKLEIANTDEITVEAGVLLGNLVNIAISSSLKGMENLSGIPGTVGGALKMNAGAYGTEISQCFESAEVVTLSGKCKTYSSKDITFSYRHSTFRDDEIIVSARFKLKSGSLISLVNQKKEVSDKRKVKQPLDVRSAGSIFKNPPHSPAGHLIDKAKLKGLKVGDAEISTKHANFIVNSNNATAEDVIQLIKTIQTTIVKRDNIKLELEIKLLGFSDNTVMGLIND